MNRATVLSIAVVLAAGSYAPAVGQRGGVADGRTPEPAAVSVKTTDPVRVAYVDHVGPYWTLGPVFTRVREAMSDADLGPMFAKFAGDPTRTSPSGLRTQVGFIAPRAYRLTPPLIAGDWAEQLVVFTVVEGPYGTTTRHYAGVYSWIAANGYEPVGPLIELYTTTGGLTAATAPRTEIRVPVRHVSSEPSPDKVRPEPTDDRIHETPGEEQPRRDWEQPVPPWVHAAPDVPPGTDPATVGANDDPRPTMDSPEPAASQSIADLIAAARYADVASRLMPPDRLPPVDLRSWLDQVVLRISAAARGIEQVYPGEGQVPRAVADAISKRHREISGAGRTTATRSVSRGAGAEINSSAASKRQVLRDLDVLLGRLALRALSAEEAVAELTAILTRVSEISGPDRGK